MRCLEHAVELDPGLAPAQRNLGALYLQAGRYAVAEKALLAAVAADRTEGLTHLHLATLYRATGRAEAARKAEEEFAPRLEGATVDFVQRVNESGFQVSLAAAAKAAVPTLDGAFAERVKTVLDTEINPAIASHGGTITLVGVEDTEIYLEMGGGCQGCAMSRMTLRQGVERMVRQAVPEVTVIHDVTDHSSGENPFFEGPTV